MVHKIILGFKTHFDTGFYRFCAAGHRPHAPGHNRDVPARAAPVCLGMPVPIPGIPEDLPLVHTRL